MCQAVSNTRFPCPVRGSQSLIPSHTLKVTAVCFGSFLPRTPGVGGWGVVGFDREGVIPVVSFTCDCRVERLPLLAAPLAVASFYVSPVLKLSSGFDLRLLLKAQVAYNNMQIWH